MLTELQIDGLRGIERAHIKGLRSLTVFIGPNGCGKTTVLEACGAICAGENGAALFRALAGREWLGLAGMNLWFRRNASAGVAAQFDAPLRGQESWRAAGLRLSVQGATLLSAFAFARALAEVPRGGWSALARVGDDGNVLEHTEGAVLAPFTLSLPHPSRAAGAKTKLDRPQYSSELRDALSEIKLTSAYDDWFEYMRELRPSLLSIESIAVGERDEPFMFEGPPRVGYPVAFAGDGFRRSLLLNANIARAKGGIAAIDEPEAFAHPRLHRALARVFRKAVEGGTQLLLATHSLEFLGTLLQAFEGNLDDVAVVGLNLENGALSSTVFAGPQAYERIVELGDDLRL
jgi:energy-coupling factor transporter ATP-binding protein EcfA2